MWITSSLKAAKTPVNIALGNFDGVHLGHQRVMAQILNAGKFANRQADQNGHRAAERLSASAIASLHSVTETLGLSCWQDRTRLNQAENFSLSIEPVNVFKKRAYSTVVTFSPHPQEYFLGVSKQLLTPVAEKAWQLSKLGVHQLVMLPFNQEMAELSPEDFVERVLVEGLQTQQISVGSDFRFGKGRSGNADRLQAIAQSHDIPVIQVPLKYEGSDRISSSSIRTALRTGDPHTAAQLLGRPYTLTGLVVKGKQLGRTIGFPTANLQLPKKKYLPSTGVYSVYVYGLESAPLRGVMNIGNRPTVDGQDLSVEVHVLDWAGDLYGQLVTVALEGFVRPEQKFESLDQLKAQIVADCRVAIATLQ